MINIVLDVETTGLPKNWSAPLNQWPRMVEFAAVKFEDGQPISDQLHFVVKPQGYFIPDEATRLHGISHAKALRVGIEIGEGLKLMKEFLEGANKIIIHNASFDQKIIAGEQMRLGVLYENTLVRDKRAWCSKMNSTQILKLPNPSGKKGFKWPSLADLCKHCEVVNEDAHSAMSDVMATYKCYLKMKEKGHWLL